MAAKGTNGTSAAANPSASTADDGQPRMGFFNTNKSFKAATSGDTQMETEKE